MDFIVKLLFLSGKYITCAASRTLIEIFNKSIEIHKRMSLKYEKAVQIVGPHNNMLELLNSHVLDASLNDEVQFAYENGVEDHPCNDSTSKVDLLNALDFVSTTYNNLPKLTVPRDCDTPTMDAVDVKTDNLTDNSIFDDLFDNYKTKENEEDIYTDVYSDLYVNFDGKRNEAKNTKQKTLPLNNTLSLEIVNPVSSNLGERLQSSTDRKTYDQTSTKYNLQEPTINSINEVGDKNKPVNVVQNTPIKVEVENSQNVQTTIPLLSENVTELSKTYGIYSESSPLSYYYKDMYMNEILSPRNSYFKSKTVNIGITKEPLANNTKQETRVTKQYTNGPLQLHTNLRKKRHKGCKTTVSKKLVSAMSDTSISASLQQEIESHFNVMDKNCEHFKTFETKLQRRSSRSKHLNYDMESTKSNHFSKFEHNLDKTLMKNGDKILSRRRLSSSTCDCEYEDLNKTIDDRIKLLKMNNRAFCKLERKITQKLIRQELFNFKSRKRQEIPYTLTAKCHLTKSDKFDIIERTKLIEINKKIFDGLEKEMKNIVIIDKNKCDKENLKQRIKDTLENTTITTSASNSLFDVLRNKIKQILSRKEVICDPFCDEQCFEPRAALNEMLHGNKTEKHKCENFKIPVSCRLTKRGRDEFNEQTENLDKNRKTYTFDTKLRSHQSIQKNSAFRARDRSKSSNLSSEKINTISALRRNKKNDTKNAVKKIALSDNNKEKSQMALEGRKGRVNVKKVDSKTATIAETLSELLDKPMKQERKKCHIEIGKNSIIINEPSVFEKFKQIILKNNISKTEQVKVIELKEKKSKSSGIKFNVPYQETKCKAKHKTDLKSSETKEYQGSEGKRLYTTEGKLTTSDDNWQIGNDEAKTKCNSKNDNVADQVKSMPKENSSRTNSGKQSNSLHNKDNIHESTTRDSSKLKSEKPLNLTVTATKDVKTCVPHSTLNNNITKTSCDKYKDDEGDDEDYSVSKYPNNAKKCVAPKEQLNKTSHEETTIENNSCTKNYNQNTYLTAKVDCNNLLNKNNVISGGTITKDNSNNNFTPINDKIAQINYNKYKDDEDDEDHSVSKSPTDNNNKNVFPNERLSKEDTNSKITAKYKEGEDDEDYSVSKNPTNTTSKQLLNKVCGEDSLCTKSDKEITSISSYVANNNSLIKTNKIDEESINRDGLEKNTNLTVDPSHNITKQSFDKFKDDERDEEDYSVSKCPINFEEHDDKVDANKGYKNDEDNFALKSNCDDTPSDSNKGNASAFPQVNKLENFLCRKNFVKIEYPKVQRNINKYDCLKYFNAREKYDTNVNSKMENKLLNKNNYEKTLIRDISKISAENPPSTNDREVSSEQDNENIKNSDELDGVELSNAAKKTEDDDINDDSQLQQFMDSNEQYEMCSEAKPNKIESEVDEEGNFIKSGETSRKISLHRNKLTFGKSSKEECDEEMENESQEQNIDSGEGKKIAEQSDNNELTVNQEINETRHGKHVTIKFSDDINNTNHKQTDSKTDSRQQTYEDELDDEDYSVSKHSNITGDCVVDKNSNKIQEEMSNKASSIFKHITGGSIINHLLEGQKDFNTTGNKITKNAGKVMTSNDNNLTSNKTDCKSIVDTENERMLSNPETTEENLSKPTSKHNEAQEINTIENKNAKKQPRGTLLNKFAFVPMNNSQTYEECNATELMKQKNVFNNDSNIVTQTESEIIKEINLDNLKNVLEKEGSVKKSFKKDYDMKQNIKCMEQQKSTVTNISKVDKRNKELPKKFYYIPQKHSNLELWYDSKELDKNNLVEINKYEELNNAFDNVKIIDKQHKPETTKFKPTYESLSKSKRLDKLNKLTEAKPVHGGKRNNGDVCTNTKKNCNYYELGAETHSANKKYAKLPSHLNKANLACKSRKGSSTSISESLSGNDYNVLNLKSRKDNETTTINHKKFTAEYPKTEYFDTTEEIDKLYNKNSASYDILTGNIQTASEDDKRKNLLEKIKANTSIMSDEGQKYAPDINKSDDSENASKEISSKESSMNKLRNFQSDIYEKFPLLRQKNSVDITKEKADLKRSVKKTTPKVKHIEPLNTTKPCEPSASQRIEWKMKYVKEDSTEESTATEENVDHISNTDKPESLHDRFPFLKKIPKPVFDVKENNDAKPVNDERVPFGKYIVHNRPVYLNKSLSPNPIPKGTMWNTRMQEPPVQPTNTKENEKSVKTKKYKLESKQICTLGKHIPITYIVEDK